MLFNSQLFLLVFLPAALLAYYACRDQRVLREWLLILASLIFYGYWEIRLVPLLLFSIAVNWLFSRVFQRFQRRVLVVLGIVLNLAIIGVFKYADFFAGSLAWLAGSEHQPWNIILPLGISFFTFQQISYLADRQKGTAPLYGFREYCLYVSFFPQLIAGPIVRHNEFIPQLTAVIDRAMLAERLSRGAAMLIVGLIKKVVLADTAGRIADPLFSAAATAPLSFVDAWVATFAFTIQIYFDFSGYSDMAIGLALMFGFTLPVNFNAPYRAVSIQDFWRRWHITLSHFLRDYLYIPLGGNRFGPARQALAAIATMFLGGLWHGAGWTFIAWGMWHGFGLAANAGWQRTGRRLNPIVGWAVTMLFVMLSWVLFRAADFGDAASILHSLIGIHGLSLAWGSYEANLAMLVVAALVALIGPTSQESVLKYSFARPWVAGPAAIAFVLLVIEVGSKAHPEFIYFQF
ncbi:MAG: MBOAT family protein [Rhodospirillaceae bacterium]|nr:MBOAT family protein [Rhodospirillaceae bacterium]MDD9929812.1 MBOAT family protein [Rhodospirillaceae bacterium]